MTETIESLRAQRNELLRMVEQASADLLNAAEALAGTKHFVATVRASRDLLARANKLMDGIPTP